LETYKCIVHFVNEKIGEFMYKIEGKAIYPLPSEIFNWTCRTGKTLHKSINIPFINENKEESLKNQNSEGNDNQLSENEEIDDIDGYLYKVMFK